jgi:hypothetical protein
MTICPTKLTHDLPERIVRHEHKYVDDIGGWQTLKHSIHYRGGSGNLNTLDKWNFCLIAA